MSGNGGVPGDSCTVFAEPISWTAMCLLSSSVSQSGGTAESERSVKRRPWVVKKYVPSEEKLRCGVSRAERGPAAEGRDASGRQHRRHELSHVRGRSGHREGGDLSIRPFAHDEQTV